MRDKRLYGPGHKEIHVGRVGATLDTGKISSQRDLYVVKNSDEPLLGVPAIKVLKLFGKIIDCHQYKKRLSKSIQKLGKIEKFI